MHLKKRLLSAAAVICTVAAAMYGSTLETGDARETANPFRWFGQKEVLYFWYSDDTMTNFINNAAVDFGEREGVHVIPVLTSESEYLEAINDASVSSEQVPDAYIISHDLLEKAYLAGLAVQIQDAAGVCNEKNFPPAALNAVSYRDMTLAYPLSFETSALVFNETYLAEWAAQVAMKELLEDGEVEDNPDENSDGISVDEDVLAANTAKYFENAIPGTVDDILTIADTFDVPQGVDMMKWDVSDIFYNYWIVGNYMIVGGDAGDDPGKIDIANPETVQCLEVYKALNQFFFIESDTVTYDSVIRDFCEGKLVFTIATTDAVKILADAKAAGEMDFDYGVALLPQVSGELASRSMSVTNAVAVNGYSDNKELANRFAAYLVDEYSDRLYDRTGKIAANLHANGEDGGAVHIFKMAYADSVPLPKMMETGNFWLQLEGLFSKVWNGADVNALVEELAERIATQVN